MRLVYTVFGCLAVLSLAYSALAAGPGKERASLKLKTQKVLVAYFSHTGNTREIATQIQKQTGGDLFEIQSVQPYPEDYDACVDQARKELDAGLKPKLKTQIQNISSYNVIFIGYPNWWATMPRPVVTFLTENDLSGKTLAPFCTHEGSGLGRSAKDIAALCPKSALLDGLAIRGSYVKTKTARAEVTGWLKKIGMLEKR